MGRHSISWLCALAILVTESAVPQWLSQQVPGDLTMLLSIDFGSTGSGVASGYSVHQVDFLGRALYSSDNGLHWNLAQVPDSARSLVTIILRGDSLGYAVGAYNIPGAAHMTSGDQRSPASFVASGARSIARFSLARIGMTLLPQYRGYFLKSTTGGQQWFPYGVLPDSTSYLTGAFFLNKRTGFASASIQDSTNTAIILKTTNGGLSWSRFVPPVRVFSLRNLCFADSLHGMVVGTRDNGTTSIGVIMSTTDGGETWMMQDFPSAAGLEDVYYPDLSTCFVVGSDHDMHPILATTSNGGTTWVQTVFAETALAYGIRFAPGTNTGIVLGDRFEYDTLGFYRSAGVYIMRTTDGGGTWTRQTNAGAPMAGITVAAKLLSPLEGYIAGGTMTTMAYIFHTTNGGATFIGFDDPAGVSDFQLLQNYPNSFNPVTTIRYSLSFQENDGVKLQHVLLTVYDVLGREVTTLVNQEKRPGTYDVTWDASEVASGVYLYRINAGAFSSMKKMLVIK